MLLLDMSSKLGTVRYADLRNTELFQSVATDGGFVSWGEGRVTVTACELMNAVLMDRVAMG